MSEKVVFAETPPSGRSSYVEQIHSVTSQNQFDDTLKNVNPLPIQTVAANELTYHKPNQLNYAV
ncbi:hypothetical protein IC229_09835 [Spirosoma sp. BT702]|uniref:Uncharacterized protein n=1 Tax=Spirosoma profusum TaxID=2771354 RepID=A0A926XZW6_9BACT|nr:hypothetical protein [Spirosoma profusum]MBD2700938.1 hypothetical protein [Spirosoma profusum]